MTTNRIPKLYGKKEKKSVLSAKKMKINKKKNKDVCISGKSAFNKKKKEEDPIIPSKTKMKKKKKTKEKEEDPIFQLIPSKTGTPKTDCDTIPKSLIQFIQETVLFKKLLELEILKINANPYSQFFLNSVDNVIHLLDTYIRLTPTPPFDKNKNKFPESFKQTLNISCDVKDAIRKYGDNGFKQLKCLLILPNFDAHGIDQAGSDTTMNAYASLLDSNRNLPRFIDCFMLNCIGKGFDYEIGVGVTRSINLDQPIVSGIGNYAVAAFNDACEMHVKKDERNNLHDFEFMECKYLRVNEACYFYMTIEAIEEGNLGVYETQVVCIHGVWTLDKFVLTDRKPVGRKAMAISHFSWIRSLCKALEDVTHEKRRKLGKIFKRFSITRACQERGIGMHALSCLLNLHTETINGLHREISLGLRFLFSPDCNRTTNPDVWSNPDNYLNSGMVLRGKGTPCRGYDYHNPLGLGMGHYFDKQSGGGDSSSCGSEQFSS